MPMLAWVMNLGFAGGAAPAPAAPLVPVLVIPARARIFLLQAKK